MTELSTITFLPDHEKAIYNHLAYKLKCIIPTNDIVVVDKITLNEASIAFSQYKSLEKEIEKVRKTIVEPLNTLVKEVNNHFKQLDVAYQISLESKRLTTQINSFVAAEQAKVEAERKAEQLRLEEEALNNAIASGKDQPAIIVENIIPDFRVSNETAFASSSVLKKWRVVDETLIPKEYFLLNELMINALRRSSKAEDKSPIPGIVFSTEYTLRAK